MNIILYIYILSIGPLKKINSPGKERNLYPGIKKFLWMES